MKNILKIYNERDILVGIIECLESKHQLMIVNGQTQVEAET